MAFLCGDASLETNMNGTISRRRIATPLGSMLVTGDDVALLTAHFEHDARVPRAFRENAGVGFFQSRRLLQKCSRRLMLPSFQPAILERLCHRDFQALCREDQVLGTLERAQCR